MTPPLESKTIMEDITGPVPEDAHIDGFSTGWRNGNFISYSSTDNSYRDRGGNVLTGIREFELDVPPDVLLRVAAEAARIQDAFQSLGFTIQNAGLGDGAKSYEVQADKVVAIENLRVELQALAKMLELTKEKITEPA